MNKSITEAQIDAISKRHGYDPRTIKAILKVECGSSGFNRDGSIKIQFEPHHFRKRTGINIDNGVDKQGVEYKAFNNAWEQDLEAALLSTSWGMPQIMGFNYKLAGYDTVFEMVCDFQKSEEKQIEGFVNFLNSVAGMREAIKTLNWRGIAKRYNGAYYERYNYHTRIEEAYNNLK